MFTKYILCILTIEWAVLGTWLLKGKGRSYERIQRNDEIREKDRFVRFQGMNLLYLALTSFPRPAHDIRRFRPSHLLFLSPSACVCSAGSSTETGNSAGRSGSGGKIEYKKLIFGAVALAYQLVRQSHY